MTHHSAIREIHDLLSGTETAVQLALADDPDPIDTSERDALERAGRDLPIALTMLYDLLPPFIEERN